MFIMIAYVLTWTILVLLVSTNTTTPVFLKCSELQGEVDRLLSDNQNLVNEASKLSETNFFLQRDESSYLK